MIYSNNNGIIPMNENITAVNEQIAYSINSHEFNKILNQFKDLYGKFIIFTKEKFNKPAKEFNESKYKKAFYRGQYTNLIHTYSIHDTSELNGNELDRYVMKCFTEFAKSNGFSISHNIATNITNAIDSSKYPDLYMAFGTRDTVNGHEAMLFVLSKNTIVKER